jgi:hypothetical protein
MLYNTLPKGCITKGVAKHEIQYPYASTMAARRFIQYVAAAPKSRVPAVVYLRCRIKPGASKVREGILAIGDSAVELCVSAAPKEGEANKAVVALLSEVSHTSL